MGRYPFTECVKAYLPVELGHISDDTYKATQRRLIQLGKIFRELKENGTVSSDNPRRITPKDIDLFVGYRRRCGISAATVLKDLGYLSKLLAYYDNEAVIQFKAKYPAHIPKRNQRRQPAMEEPVVQRILDRAREIPVTNWRMMEAYGLVTLAVCTGFRPKELQMLSCRNVFFRDGHVEIHAIHVKGEGSYGSDRWVTVHPDGVPILMKYLEARRIRLEKAGKNEDALFPPILNREGYISYKRIRILKSYVEEDLDEAFELRKCRRTFGQRALNEGHNIHNVSLVMGHSTLATTQRYYCDKEQRSASAEMREHWSKNGSPEDVPGA